MNWIDNANHLIGLFKCELNEFNTKNRIAAFDLDDTIIISTKSNTEDYMLYNNEIINKLRDCNTNYRIVIVTNQNGIEKGYLDKQTWINKISALCKQIDVPLLVLVSLHNDCYRKPRTGLFIGYVKYYKKTSFFCGDAGGLGKRKIYEMSIKKDFSDTDIKFSYNLGIRFMHRDEFIYNIKYETISVKYPVDFNKILIGNYDEFMENHIELVLMVGFPGSGKSYYARKYVEPKGYQYVSQDVCKTLLKCLKECELGLKNGLSVVCDNTNPTIEVRKKYIELAKKYDVKCRVIIIDADKFMSVHNNIYRHCLSMKINKIIPMVAYNKYNKVYVKPSLEEGFYQIDLIPFKLSPDVNVKDYFKYYF